MVTAARPNLQSESIRVTAGAMRSLHATHRPSVRPGDGARCAEKPSRSESRAADSEYVCRGGGEAEPESDVRVTEGRRSPHTDSTAPRLG